MPWALPDAERARKVRLALNLAVDKQAIIQRVLGGLGTPGRHGEFLPTDAVGDGGLVQPYPYDPVRQKLCWRRPAIPRASR